MAAIRPQIVACLFVASVATGTALAEQSSQEMRFGDWDVSCDAADFCVASTSEATRLVIQRHRPSEHLELLVDMGVAGGDFPQEFTVQVDDLIERFEGFDEFGPYGGRGRFHFLSDKAQDVLAAMIDGRTARFALLDETDDTTVMEFSLVGLSASLLWIDERQQRIGSPRLAGDPPYGLLPFGPSIDASVTVPPGLVAAHRASEECDPFEWLSASGRDSIVATLDDTHAIAVLPCWEGAYNFSATVYRLRGETFSREYFAEYSHEQSWFVAPVLVNVNLDPATKEIATFDKGRGPGDCGSVGRWAWTGNGFRLEEYRYQAECDASVEPGDFPVIFTARPSGG